MQVQVQRNLNLFKKQQMMDSIFNDFEDKIFFNKFVTIPDMI